MDGRILDGWMDGWILDGWMDGYWMDGWMYGWMDRLVYRYVGRYIGTQIGGWMDGQTERAKGRTDRSSCECECVILHHCSYKSGTIRSDVLLMSVGVPLSESSQVIE